MLFKECDAVKAKGKRKRRIFEALDLPEETLGDVLKCTILGQETMLIENHGGIIEYTDKFIRLSTVQGGMSVSGDDLMLLELGAERVYIRGHIRAVSLEV